MRRWIGCDEDNSASVSAAWKMPNERIVFACMMTRILPRGWAYVSCVKYSSRFCCKSIEHPQASFFARMTSIVDLRAIWGDLSHVPHTRISLARIYVGFGWTEETLNSLLYALEVKKKKRTPTPYSLFPYDASCDRKTNSSHRPLNSFVNPLTLTRVLLVLFSLSAAQVLEDPQVKNGQVPSVVQNTLRALVAKVGLQAVREVQLKNSRRDSHPAVDNLLHDVVRWKVIGWDR